MSVPKSQRGESKFEVLHHLIKMRKEVMKLVLINFGYSQEKLDNHISHWYFSNRPYESLTEDEQKLYDKEKSKLQELYKWIILDERKIVTDCLRNITKCIYLANNIYPKYYEELIQRRIYQDRAIGLCAYLLQELQFAVETLPVKTTSYVRFIDMIQREISLIKNWRKSDNSRFKNLESQELNFLNKLKELFRDLLDNKS